MSDTYVVNAAGKPVIVKDPDAVLDYTFDWTEWLQSVSDTIVPSTGADVTCDTGLTVQTVNIIDGQVIAWLEGGTVGNQYNVECQITTVDGRVDRRSIAIKIKVR
jgi:hypothetical protein